MCLIIDVNVAHKILLTDRDTDFKDVHQGLFKARRPLVTIVYSQHLIEECKNLAVRRILAELDRAGRAKRVNDQEVNLELQIILQKGICRSNDAHIIALARVSHVRLLCSHDQTLHTDFTDKRLINNPRGKVYQKHKHKKLLRKFCN